MVRRTALALTVIGALFQGGCKAGSVPSSASNPPPSPRISSDGPSQRADAKGVPTVDTGAAAAVEKRPPGQLMILLYSANLLGEYEAHPLGGLARRKTAAQLAQKEQPAVLQLDAGDTLLPPPEPATAKAPPLDRGEVERRMRLLLKGLSQAGLQA